MVSNPGEKKKKTLHGNGKDISTRLMEIGRKNDKQTYFRAQDVFACVRQFTLRNYEKINK